jgi:hypothetical protein
MQFQPGSLPAATADLEAALGAPIHDPASWAEHLEDCLTGVQQAILRQAGEMEAPGGGLVDVGADQFPSPGMQRRIDRLLGELGELLDETRTVRAGARRVAVGSAANPDGLRSRGLALIDALRRHDQEQARVVLEGVATDIGAGD